MVTKIQSAISVRRLSKSFKLYTSPNALLKEFMGQVPQEFVALDNVSFDVRQGEAVGIMGRNGAGKSTLLRIIAGTLDKTSGSVAVNGRVSAILELGTGFRPEYTGRENVITGGLCLGMSRKEIESKLESIIDFSELDEFIDRPFKTYSSGMQARLTFSTAVHIDPDILIVDEALGVGDAKFQRKCFEKMNQFRQKGCAILLVSHDMNTVASFCDRAILLQRGQVLMDDNAADVSRVYYQMLLGNGDVPKAPIVAAVSGEDEACIAPSPQATRTGTQNGAELVAYAIETEQGRSVNTLVSGQRFTVRIRARFHRDILEPTFGFLVRDVRGVDVFGVDTFGARIQLPPCKAGGELEFRLPCTMWLAKGNFFLSPSVGCIEDGATLDMHLDALCFSVSTPLRVHDISLVNMLPEFDRLSVQVFGS